VRLKYEEHTWRELRELAERDDLVVVIPTATLEDHGHHLPIDTDVRLVEAITRGAVEASDGQALLFPTQVHGYTPHHLDFPGSVTLRWNVFVESLLDQGRSLCRHGFDRILFVNGHGSNQPLVDIAARLVGLEHHAGAGGRGPGGERRARRPPRAAVGRAPGRDEHPARLPLPPALPAPLRPVRLDRPRAAPRGRRRSPRGLSPPGTNFVTLVCRGVNRGDAGVILAGCRPRT
jgi:hypothetical protein